MRLVDHTSYFMTHLLMDARSGALVLPDFQRPYVWGDQDVINLLDSAVQGFPLGNILLWGGWWRGAGPAARGHVRPFAGCPVSATAPTLVLDGQQRLQALLIASSAESPYVWNCHTNAFSVGTAEPKKGIFHTKWLFDWMFDEKHALFNSSRPQVEKVVREEIQVPAHGRKKATTRVMETPIYYPLTAEQEAIPAMIVALDKVICLFKDLRLGALMIAPEASLAYARDVFRRTNTMGKPFREEEVFAALAGANSGT